MKPATNLEGGQGQGVGQDGGGTQAPLRWADAAGYIVVGGTNLRDGRNFRALQRMARVCLQVMDGGIGYRACAERKLSKKKTGRF